ncbi:MAG: hypothetical protein COB73_09840 [Flavobacteriaceae bacterium]|nr:MAG: hypothetical protein COB73_09840 [Flavobacteriaceae bacterium]
MNGAELNKIKNTVLQPMIDEFVFHYQDKPVRHYITYDKECRDKLEDVLKSYDLPRETYNVLFNKYRVEMQERIRKLRE